MNNVLRKWLGKSPPEPKKDTTGESIPGFDCKELQDELGEDYRVFMVNKPFVRVTKTKSYQTVDIYPVFKSGKVKLITNELEYENIITLANKIKSVYSREGNRG